MVTQFKLPPADTELFPIDGNDQKSDCVVASTAHLFYVLFGVVIPLATVLKTFANWCSSGGCSPGWFMWKVWWNGLHGKHIKQFCRLRTKADIDWAINNLGGCIIGVLNDSHQATIIGKVNDLYRVVVWGLNGWIKDLKWEDIAGSGGGQLQLSNSGGHFAMSSTYKPYMLWLSFKNTYMWWIVVALLTVLVWFHH